MYNLQAMVRAFMQRFNLYEGNLEAPVNLEALNLWSRLVEEEAGETVAAAESLQYASINYPNFGWSDGKIPVDHALTANVVDGAIDTIYVCLGLLTSLGLDAGPLFAEVHKTNMAKIGGGRAENGKILKPAGWAPPDLIKVIRSQMEAAKLRAREFWYL